MTALAAIDRIVHHSVILDMMEVESYRATKATILQRAQEGSTEKELIESGSGLFDSVIEVELIGAEAASEKGECGQQFKVAPSQRSLLP